MARAIGATVILVSVGCCSGNTEPNHVERGNDVLFHSDWSTAVGTSHAAILDTAKARPWSADITLNNGDAMTVVDSRGLDFPTANVLQVHAVWRPGVPGAYAANPRYGSLSTPATGESFYYRWYIRVAIPDSYNVDELTHPIQDGLNGSSTNWMFEIRTNTNGTWTLTYNVAGSGQNDWPNNRWGLAATAMNTDPLALNKNQTYRMEIQIKRVATEKMEIHARVYDSGDTLLYDDDDFKNIDGSASMADNTELNINDVNTMGRFQVGHNGFTGGVESDYGFTISYQGGVAVCAQDWCGPYNGEF